MNFDKWNSSIPFHQASSVALLFVPKTISLAEPLKVDEIFGSPVAASNFLYISVTICDQIILAISEIDSALCSEPFSIVHSN